MSITWKQNRLLQVLGKDPVGKSAADLDFACPNYNCMLSMLKAVWKLEDSGLVEHRDSSGAWLYTLTPAGRDAIASKGGAD